MRYIRFLKSPRLENGAILALLTITSDLGDSFLTKTVGLLAQVRTATDVLLESHDLRWTSGQRVLRVRIQVRQSDILGRAPPAVQLVLHISAAREGPGIVAAWSSVADMRDPEEALEVGNQMVQRRITMTDGAVIRIYEETGESIARHIWDAGLALVSHLNTTAARTPSSPPSQAKPPPPFTALELGCGCALVGIALAHLVPNTTLLLTDLPAARTVATTTISHTALPPPSHASFHVLDWHEPTLPQLPAALASPPPSPLDMVLLSDCTYNADSSPALVRTLAALAGTAPALVVLVAMKVRHESEAVFFTLMGTAGFVVRRKTVLRLPMLEEEEEGMEEERVDVYVFTYGDGGGRVPWWAEEGMVLRGLWEGGEGVGESWVG